MRPVRNISAEDNARMVSIPGTPFDTIKRDSVEPEPVGTIVLMAFRITGYDPDCDRSLMARLENIDKDGEETGWESSAIGLYSESELVVTADEWRGMFESAWQDIATAKQDGTTLLLYGTQRPHDMPSARRPLVFTGYWNSNDGAWCGTSSTWSGPFYDCTKWQPNIEPPVDT